MAARATHIRTVEDRKPALTRCKWTGFWLNRQNKRRKRIEIRGQTRVRRPKFGIRIPLLDQSGTGLQGSNREFEILDFVPVGTPMQRQSSGNTAHAGGVPRTRCEMPGT